MSGQILIVEPIPTQRIVLRALLEKARYRVEQCCDAAAARRLLAQGVRPDLVLLRTSDLLAGGAASEAMSGLVAGLKTGRAEACSGAAQRSDTDIETVRRFLRPAVSPNPVPLVIALDDLAPDRAGRKGTLLTNTGTTRIDALNAGADDVIVISRPFAAPFLLARIRNLLRARAELEDLRPRNAAERATERADGFAEAVAAFDLPQRIVVLAAHAPDTPNSAGLPLGLSHALAGLAARDPARFEIYPLTADFDETDDEHLADMYFAQRIDDLSTGLGGHGTGIAPGRPAPDLIIIDPAVGTPGGMTTGEIFRLMSELRSGSPLRLASQLLIVPEDAADLATMALDMGIDDLVTDAVGRDELAHRIETLLRQKKIADGMRASVRRDLEAAVIDPLTGLHNRRFAMPHLDMLVEEADATLQTFAVMMLDIDHFKRINDTYGHATGDCVLRAVARRLKDQVGPRDMVARIGGEEFLVVLPEITEAGARIVAERLRRVIAARPFDGNDPDCALPQPGRSRIDVTLSVGVALGGDGHPRDTGAVDLYDRADRALYAAKEAGRNTVTLGASAA